MDDRHQKEHLGQDLLDSRRLSPPNGCRITDCHATARGLHGRGDKVKSKSHNEEKKHEENHPNHNHPRRQQVQEEPTVVLEKNECNAILQ